MKSMTDLQRSPDSDSRWTFTVEEAAKLLGVSRGSAYEAVRRGELPSIRVGKRILVPRAALERLVLASDA
jgi:excisionase family DNA binding protein